MEIENLLHHVGQVKGNVHGDQIRHLFTQSSKLVESEQANASSNNHWVRDAIVWESRYVLRRAVAKLRSEVSLVDSKSLCSCDGDCVSHREQRERDHIELEVLQVKVHQLCNGNGFEEHHVPLESAEGNIPARVEGSHVDDVVKEARPDEEAERVYGIVSDRKAEHIDQVVHSHETLNPFCQVSRAKDHKSRSTSKDRSRSDGGEEESSSILVVANVQVLEKLAPRTQNLWIDAVVNLHANTEPGVLGLVIADEMNFAVEIEGDSIAIRQSLRGRDHWE
mmetsp:Transcript_8958/g.17465  ORF Transcript_8958/g.17465 Transcript_8958/m.17465 type:complete len:279 (+) Transcript_8958:270-1106(+)